LITGGKRKFEGRKYGATAPEETRNRQKAERKEKQPMELDDRDAVRSLGKRIKGEERRVRSAYIQDLAKRCVH